MPRVPIIDSPQVQPRALPAPTSRDNVGAGLDAQLAGDALTKAGAVGAHVASAYAEGLQKANAVAVASAMTDLQREGNTSLYDSQKGLMQQKGVAAHAASGQVYDTLNKRRDALLMGLNNEEQRALFRLHAGSYLEDVHRQVESYAGQQLYVATEAAAKDAVDEATAGVKGAYQDDEAFNSALNRVAPLLGKLALSPEDAEAKATQFRRRLVAERIEEAATRGDIPAVERLSKAFDKDLAASPDLERKVRTLLSDAEMDSARQEIIKRNTDADTGQLDAISAEEDANSIDSNKPWKKDIINAIRVDAADARRRGHEEAEDVFNKGVVIMQEHGLFSPAMSAVKAYLTDERNSWKGAGDFWNRLKKQYADDNRAERSVRASERAQQAQNDDLAMKLYMGAGDAITRAGINVSDFVGTGLGVSQRGLAAIAAQQVKDKSEATKARTPGDSEFNTRVQAAIQGVLPKLGDLKKHERESVSTDIRARLETWRFQYKQEHQGREPSADEVSKAIATHTQVGVKHIPILPDRRRLLIQVPDAERKDYVPEGGEETRAPINPLPKKEAPPAGTVRVVGPNGQTGTARSEGIEEWLQAHPDWKLEGTR